MSCAALPMHHAMPSRGEAAIASCCCHGSSHTCVRQLSRRNLGKSLKWPTPRPPDAANLTVATTEVPVPARLDCTSSTYHTLASCARPLARPWLLDRPACFGHGSSQLGLAPESFPRPWIR